MFVRRCSISLLCLGAACRGAVVTAARPTGGAASLGALRASIDSMVDAPQFANAHWGILIVDPGRGETLYARNAGKLFMPASNMKILTSAAALARFGPDYRYATTFAARGRISDGSLAGDLVVTGRGDPSLSDHMLGDAMAPLRAIADSIVARGVTHIAGRVVAGGDPFPGEVLGYGWSYDDFEDSYSAPIDELLFNEGFGVLHVRGGARAGDAVTVDVTPAHTVPRVRVAARTVDAPNDTAALRRARTVRARKDSVTWDVVVEGDVPARDTTSIEVTHHDPGRAYVAAVTEALRGKGVVIDEAPADTLAPLETLATLSSPPLSEILKALMKPSQNQIAEMLFRTLALDATGSGRPDSASLVVQRQLAQWGVVPSEAVIRDGSGLSRYDYISPRTVVRILDAMRRSPDFRVYYDALPIAGVDGTIRSRMKGTPAEGNVHAKTGSVALSRSLSGYATTANGRLLIFSFLSNNWTVPIRDVERVQDAIGARLAAMQLP
jgi:D-alanyl-D-alanine carboxypeptidase/D-alanyl-D-alanine-endopeptidase (penicillin-binding protein 4)